MAYITLGLVVEDAIAGLKSGRATGAQTLAVCTSTPLQTIMDSDANPNYIVTDLTKCAFFALIIAPRC